MSASTLIRKIEDQLRSSGNLTLKKNIQQLIKYTEALEKKVPPMKRPKILNGVVIGPGRGADDQGPVPKDREALKKHLEAEQEVGDQALILIGYTEELERMVPDNERP